jgi:hypothetical protein
MRVKNIGNWKKIATVFLCFLLSFTVTVFYVKKPSHNRVWQSEFSVMPEVTINGDIVEIKNMRDWRYTSSGPYQKNYLTRQFNVKELERVWFLVEPFSGWDGVAHTYFVFDFKNQEPLVFSVEARRDGNEQFSAPAGLFKQFEVIYLWGTEKDFTVSRVLTYNNKVYMYPLQISNDSQQKLFLELANKTIELAEHPRFYNTLTSNCTSILADHANNVKKGTVPFHYARFLPGYSAPLLQELGYLDNSISYDELRNKYYISEYVKNDAEKEDFSLRLRQHLL